MRFLFVLGLAVFAAAQVNAQTFCGQVTGAVMVANDGTFLGEVSNEFNANSIFNEFGPYGSEFSQSSIFNEFSNYGSPFSMLSAFNEFTTTPPLLVKNNQVIAVVSLNDVLTGALNPYSLLSCK